MVGGLADWFAVTALFRHPLGLPIPHTAIIPRKKDQIGGRWPASSNRTSSTGRSWPSGCRRPRSRAGPGEWLARAEARRGVAADIGSGSAALASVLRDDEMRGAILGYVDRRLHETSVAPGLARAIDAVLRLRSASGCVDRRAPGAHAVLGREPVGVARPARDESPDWVPTWVDERVFNRASPALQSFLADVIAEDDHALRRGFDRRLRDYAQRLRTDPAVAARVEEAKNQLLDRPDVHDWFAALWTQLKTSVLAERPIRAPSCSGLAALIGRSGEALGTTTQLRAKVDGG